MTTWGEDQALDCWLLSPTSDCYADFTCEADAQVVKQVVILTDPVLMPDGSLSYSVDLGSPAGANAPFDTIVCDSGAHLFINTTSGSGGSTCEGASAEASGCTPVAVINSGSLGSCTAENSLTYWGCGIIPEGSCVSCAKIYDMCQ